LMFWLQAVEIECCTPIPGIIKVCTVRLSSLQGHSLVIRL
jgi:hypothetical protein